MSGDCEDPVMLDELITHRYVIEILDLLSESGCTTALLVRILKAPSPDLAAALRLIAAHGLLSTAEPGSWDEPLLVPGALHLTDRGEAVARILSHPTVARALSGDRPHATRHLFRRRGRV
ncbi:hypothetical protein [Nocardia heshunensis]